MHSWFGWHGSLASAGGECCGGASGLVGGHMRMCGVEGKEEGREEQIGNGEVPLERERGKERL